MINSLTSFLFSASLAAATTPASRWLSIKLGAVDLPDGRKVHRAEMPRMGGLAIVVAFLLPIAMSMAVKGGFLSRMPGGYLQVAAFFGGALVVSILGVVDDIRGVRARSKFIVQIVVAALAWFCGFRFGNLGIPFIGQAELPVWLDLPLTVAWIAGVINAMNLIDGLDGLAAGVAFFVAATNFVLAIRGGNEVAAIFSVTLAGAVIGFLLFNWNPAIVFMGDTGSMFLGYVLATTSIVTSQKTSTAVAMLVPIVALGVPVMDTLLSMVRRFLERRPLFSPDKGHLHHRLLRLGLNHRRAVLVIYGLSLVFAALAIAMTAAKDVEAAVIMGVLAVVVIGIVRFFGFFSVSRAIHGAMNRSRIAEKLRAELPDFTGRVVREAESPGGVWRELVELLRKCSCREVSWRTTGIKPPDERREVLFDESSPEHARFAKKGFQKIKISSPLAVTSYIEVRVVYPVSMGKLSPDTDTIFQLVVDAVAAGLSRLRSAGVWAQEPRVQDAAPCESVADGAGDEGELRGECGPGGDDSLDAVWSRFLSLCESRGFVGAGWKSFGVKPADERNHAFDGAGDSHRSVIRRSVPVTSLSFFDLKFVYPGKPGKKTPVELRKAAGEISHEIGFAIRDLEHQGRMPALVEDN